MVYGQNQILIWMWSIRIWDVGDDPPTPKCGMWEVSKFGDGGEDPLKLVGCGRRPPNVLECGRLPPSQNCGMWEVATPDRPNPPIFSSDCVT